jgi:glycosyltransferase involved in cell wall biosynthesis
MHVLHYVHSTDTTHGGVPRFVLDASRVMADRGHRSTILTWDTTHTPKTWIPARDGGARGDDSTDPVAIQIPTPSIRSQFFSSGDMRRVREFLLGVDVIHLHCIWSPSSMQVAAAAREMNIPYVVSSHGMLDDWSMSQSALKKRAYLSLAGRYFLDKAAVVHTTAQAELDQSKKWFPKGHEVVIPYLMDLEPYRELPGAEIAKRRFHQLRDDVPNILFLSRLHVKKGIEHLIRAAAELNERGVDANFIIAGTGFDPAYTSSLERMVRTMGLSKMIHFVGHVVGAEKISLYEACDLFVLPTSQENFGLVLTEAMACGTPVITTKGVDIWRDIQASGGGSIVDQDATSIADEIQRLVESPATLESMAMNARPWVMTTFDEKALSRGYESLYQSCADHVVPALRPVPALESPALETPAVAIPRKAEWALT